MTADPAKLLGRYRTPRFKYGNVVSDTVRGDVEIVGLSDGRIPWPIGKRNRGKSLVVFGDLERAIRTESNLAVCYWWGIRPQTVTKWRNALGVGAVTPGTSRLRREALAPRGNAMRAKIDYDDAERNAKIAAARRGKPRPPHVIEALRQANRGRRLSEGHRRKISEVNLRNGNRPPKAGRPWTEAEDALLRKLPAAEVAEQSGRTLRAVYMRRSLLGVSDGRRR